MSVICLCNVGNRDVKFKGEFLAAPRADGQRLLLSWDELDRGELSLPIIEPVLSEILRREECIDRLVLFASDQDPAMTERRHWQRDTLYLAEIIARWLKAHEDLGDRIGQVEVQLLLALNPSLYDMAFGYFGPKVAAYHNKEVKTCYAIVVGGTAAMNMALLFHAVRLFGERCRTVYQPEGGEPFSLAIGQQIAEAMRQESVITHLKRGDFAAALTLMEGCAPRPLCALIRYAKHRFYFDFKEAQEALEEAITASHDLPSIRQFALSLRRELERVRAGRLESLIVELYFNTVLTYEAEHYVDFLGRLFRFREAVLRHIVETIYGLPTDMSEDARARYAAGIEANPYLLEYLQEVKIGGEPLNYREVNQTTMTALLSYLVDPERGKRADGRPYLNDKQKGGYEGIGKRLNRFENLSRLRNESIIAHGFRGVSKEIILEEYKGEPLDDMKAILGILRVGEGESPYRRIADFVIEGLRRAP